MANKQIAQMTENDRNEDGVGRHAAYLSLGSNLGDRRTTMRRAVEMLGMEAGTIDRRSSMIETEPWGFDSSNRFLNMCVRIVTSLSPERLLALTKDIELRLGRTVKSTDGTYHDRPIDIDILTYDNVRLSTPELTLPHPHMCERDFVMTPLWEIMDEKEWRDLLYVNKKQVKM